MNTPTALVIDDGRTVGMQQGVALRVVRDTEAADEAVSDVFRRIAVGNERCARTHVRRWLAAATHAAAVERIRD